VMPAIILMKDNSCPLLIWDIIWLNSFVGHVAEEV